MSENSDNVHSFKRVKQDKKPSFALFKGNANLIPLSQAFAKSEIETQNSKIPLHDPSGLENGRPIFNVSQVNNDRKEDADWQLDKEWYDQEEGEVEKTAGQVFLLDEVDNELNFKSKILSLNVMRKNQRSQEQEKWEIQRMIDSGVYERPKAEVEIEDESARVVLEAYERKPTFLKNKRLDASNTSNVHIIRSPGGDFALATKKGSALLRNLREKNERIKASSGFDVSGSRMANVLKANLDRAEPVESDHDHRRTSQFASAFKHKINKDKMSDFSKSKSIQQQREYLPIFSVRKDLMQLINDNKIVVVVGKTGCGKTTQLTQYLLEEGYGKHGIIACTQPRRVAAVSVAARVAEERSTVLGDEVGYAIRFEVVCSPHTKIKYMTDGVLLRESLSDQMLEQYSAIIMDEAHERSLHTDVLFGVLKAISNNRRDLKLIVTSATMNEDKFSKFFNNAPIFTIPGRTYQVDNRYADQVVEDYVDAAIKKAIEIHLKEMPGDILIFMTGQEDVEATCQVLAERLFELDNIPMMLILPIYSQLPSESQRRIFEPSDLRKCIVATNIAETSLTLDQVRYVIDTGLCKLKVYNPKIGMDGLQVTIVSQANADQRSGRAGRTGPGKCFRLFKATAYKNEMFPNNVPEIQRTNLANVVLLLKSLNIDDLLTFDFMDPPPQETILNAMYQLWILGALDNLGRLTATGKKMAEFPLDPPLSKIVLVAEEMGCSKEALKIVSMLSVPAILFRPKGNEQVADTQHQKMMVPESDHLTLLNVYNLWKQHKYSSDWSKQFFVNQKSLVKVREIKRQLKEIMGQLGLALNSCNHKLDIVRKAICAGYFINAARIKSIGEYFNLRTGMMLRLHPSSALFCMGYVPDYVVYHEVILTSREYIHCVTAVDPHWLAELGPMFFRLKESIGEEKMRLRYFKGDKEWEESKLDEVYRKEDQRREVESSYNTLGKRENSSVVRFGNKSILGANWRRKKDD